MSGKREAHDLMNFHYRAFKSLTNSSLCLGKAYRLITRLSLLMLLWSSPALAERHALLIGAGKYDNPNIPDLAAVSNDIALMISLSRNLGVKDVNIRLLAEKAEAENSGLTSRSRATRNAILEELNRLTESVRLGDEILIYYSGHGSQQPDTASKNVGRDEADGWDEIILPVDTGSWSFDEQKISNAITDDELGRYLDNIRIRGANVWLIMDSCNSGTLLRSDISGVRQVKAVAPYDLGIPSTWERGGFSTKETPLSDIGGKITAFYAAPSNQLALSDIWKNEGKLTEKPYSLLTFALNAAMRKPGVSSYRDLAYLTGVIYGMQRKPVGIVPQFSGEMESGILGSKKNQVNSWPVIEQRGQFILQAGSLDLLKNDDLIEVSVPGIDQAPVLFRISDAQLTFSALQRISGDTSLIFNSSYLNGTLKGSKASLSVHVYMDFSPENDRTNLIKKQLENRSVSGLEHINLTSTKALSDITISFDQGTVSIYKSNLEADMWSGGSTEVNCSNDECINDLTQKLERYAKAMLLTRVLLLNSRTKRDQDIAISASLQRARQKDNAPCGPWRNEIPKFLVLDSSRETSNSTPLILNNCDQIEVRVSMGSSVNETDAADITALYIGADGTIANMFSSGQNIRLQAGDSIIGRQRATRTSLDGAIYPYGAEYIMILVFRQKADKPVRDFSWPARAAANLRDASNQNLQGQQSLEVLFSNIANENKKTENHNPEGEIYIFPINLLFKSVS